VEHYFKFAANQGSIDAQYEYGIVLRNGNGFLSDLAQAAPFLKFAAQGNYPAAQSPFAALLCDGRGVSKD
jgi:TPR repeat protein